MFDYINYKGEVIITGYKGSATEVVIPSEIEGKPVTSIGILAFCERRRLKSVTIPDSVTIIGSWAFNDCTGLTDLKIPNSVTSIGYAAFDGCNSLKDVYYAGTAEQWEQIEIGSYNRELYKAKKHFIRKLN